MDGQATGLALRLGTPPLVSPHLRTDDPTRQAFTVSAYVRFEAHGPCDQHKPSLANRLPTCDDTFMGANDRTLNIVGESYRNPDGSSRQAEIRRLRVGERVELRRQPENPHDPMAVAVHGARGPQIGFLSSDHARWIGGKIDGGYPVKAIIERINGGVPGKPSLGVCIRINYDGDDPQLPGLWNAFFRLLRR